MASPVRAQRVIFVNRYIYPDHSATSQILADLAEGLARAGFDVCLLGSRQRYDDPAADLPPDDFWGSIHLRRVRSTRFGRGHLLGRAVDYLSFYASVAGALLGLIRRGEIVVAKTDPPLLSVLVAIVAWLRGARMINWLQDVFPEVAVALGEPRLPGPVLHMLAWLRDRSLVAARANVVIGGRMAERLAARAPLARFVVVPNWAHEDAVRPLPVDRSELRHQLGLAKHFVVGYSGNLGRAHDHETIYDAAVLLRDRAEIVFLIIGDGTGYRALEARARASGLRNLHFLPYQPLDRLADSMAAANVHLVSLRPALEGLIVPSKFFGILAAARPVVFIGDPDGELARVIETAGCGVIVPEGAGEMLANALLDLASDRSRCVAMGERGRALLDSCFARAEAHAAWMRLLADVAQEGSMAS